MSDVEAGVGDVDVEEVFAGEMQTREDGHSLPQEMSLRQEAVAHPHDGDVIGLLVPYQHLGLYPCIVKGVLEAVGGQGGTARSLARVDNEYSHSKGKSKNKISIFRINKEKMLLLSHTAVDLYQEKGIFM